MGCDDRFSFCEPDTIDRYHFLARRCVYLTCTTPPLGSLRFISLILPSSHFHLLPACVVPLIWHYTTAIFHYLFGCFGSVHLDTTVFSGTCDYLFISCICTCIDSHLPLLHCSTTAVVTPATPHRFQEIFISGLFWVSLLRALPAPFFTRYTITVTTPFLP